MATAIVFTSEADFLTKFSQYKNQISQRLVNDFCNVKNPHHRPMGENSRFRLVDSSKMADWDTSLFSNTLGALALKMGHMAFTIGSPNSIIPMLEKIATGRVKTLSKPTEDGKEYLGKGSFRWDNTVYILNETELDFIREYLRNIS